MNRIHSGDTVIVITGKDKGFVGEVGAVKGERVTVKGANMVSKHKKPNPSLNQPGGIIKIESSIHISNVAIYNTEEKKADKVAFKFVEQEAKNGTDRKRVKIRCFKSNDKPID